MTVCARVDKDLTIHGSFVVAEMMLYDAGAIPLRQACDKLPLIISKKNPLLRHISWPLRSNPIQFLY